MGTQECNPSFHWTSISQPLVVELIENTQTKTISNAWTKIYKRLTRNGNMFDHFILDNLQNVSLFFFPVALPPYWHFAGFSSNLSALLYGSISSRLTTEKSDVQIISSWNKRKQSFGAYIRSIKTGEHKGTLQLWHAKVVCLQTFFCLHGHNC